MNLSDLKQTLLNLPEKIYQAEIAQTRKRLLVDEAQESVEIAEVNASLTAIADGKNEKERELQRKTAIAKDPDVKAAKEKLSFEKLAMADAAAEEASLRRQYGAMLAIAELSAAQLNLQAAQTKEKGIEHGK